MKKIVMAAAIIFASLGFATAQKAPTKTTDKTKIVEKKTAATDKKIVEKTKATNLKKDGTPDMRYSQNKQSSMPSTPTTPTNITPGAPNNEGRPIYPGDKYTTPHDGHYQNEQNVHHKWKFCQQSPHFIAIFSPQQ